MGLFNVGEFSLHSFYLLPSSLSNLIFNSLARAHALYAIDLRDAYYHIHPSYEYCCPLVCFCSMHPVQDFCMAAWAYSLWLLVKRLFLSIVLNVLDGSANAILALVVQFVDTILLLYSRPYINRQTEVAESIGAVTNLLVMFCLSFFNLQSTSMRRLTCNLFSELRGGVCTCNCRYRCRYASLAG